MQVHFGKDLLVPEWRRSVVSIGSFDGVHLGHRKVISAAVEMARERECPSVVVTFDRHPAATLAPERKPKCIASLEQNLAHFESLGVAIVLVLPFNSELAALSASDFFDTFLKEALKAEAVAIGHDFRFGHSRQGTPEWLSGHIETHVMPPIEFDGRRVSSSQIRTLVEEGAMEQATRLLGRPFAIPGTVCGGQKLGRTIGYPTLNVERSIDQVTPRFGVYGGFCETHLGRFGAAVSIGIRPTVGGQHRTIEAYLIDYPGDSLYGASVELSLTHWIRPEQKFETLEALTDAIRSDVGLATKPPSIAYQNS